MDGSGVSRGVAYVAYGAGAQREMLQSQAGLLAQNQLPVLVAPEMQVPGVAEPTDVQRSRWAKLSVLEWTAWDRILYLDADTRIRGSLAAGWAMLEDGWDVALAVSRSQGDDWLWHVSDAERSETEFMLGCRPVQLQAGLMFVRRCAAVQRLFAAWREEWMKWRDQDQAALLRALMRAPVRTWLLGAPWNGGALVEHRCGQARRR